MRKRKGGMNMQVELAKSAGFCFGVQRAVDTVYKQIEENSAEEDLHLWSESFTMKKSSKIWRKRELK